MINKFDTFELIKETIHGNKKLGINRDYFEKIDTHNKSYLLGLLYADGHINEIKNTVKIQLKNGEDELSLLNQIKNEMKYTGEIKKYKDKSIRICFFDKKLKNDLINKGLSNNKWNKIRFPYFIDSKFYNSFILGYFDGDGTIHRINVGKNLGLFSFRFVGNQEFLSELNEVIKNNVGISSKFVPDKRRLGVGYLSYTLKNTSKLRDYLYSGSSIFLKRKNNVFYENK
jgi:hypothetical protein